LNKPKPGAESSVPGCQVMPGLTRQEKVKKMADKTIIDKEARGKVIAVCSSKKKHAKKEVISEGVIR